MQWISVCTTDELENNQHLVVELDDTDVIVFRLDDKFYAIEDICSHDGGKISGGMCENGEIICPRHGARFCIKTGAVKSPPAYEGVECYAVRIEGNTLQIQHPRD